MRAPKLENEGFFSTCLVIGSLFASYGKKRAL